MFPDLVDGADMGMVQSGGGARFALKAFQSLVVLGKMFGEQLQGNEAAEPSVFGLVDHTHTAATQLLKDAVVRNSLANHAEGIQSCGLSYVLTAGRSTGRAGKLARLPRYRLAKPTCSTPKLFLFGTTCGLQRATVSRRWGQPTVNGVHDTCGAKTIRPQWQ